MTKTLGQSPDNRMALLSEILSQRDVMFEAIGGNGEPGCRGGNVQSGRDGRPDMDGTKVQNATPGTHVGNGAAAGNGTSGADGVQG